MIWNWSSRAALLLVASTVAVTWAQTGYDYEVGLTALGEGRYGDAVTVFERASANPLQGTYPLYHLGKAHRCSGRDDAAKQAFEASFFAEDLGGRSDLLDARDRQLTDEPPPCADIPQVAPMPVAATSSIPLRPTTTAPRTTASASTTVPRITTSAATTTPEDVDVDVDEEREGRSVAAERAFANGCAEFEPLAPEEAMTSFREATELDPEHSSARLALQTAERLLDVLEAIRGHSIRRAAEVFLELAEPCNGKEFLPLVEEELRAAALRKAHQSFEARLDGNYEAAIGILEDAISGLEDRPNAHLYLGLYYYSQYILRGESKAELVDQARSHVSRALELDPNLKVDPRLVSPRLAKFVDEERNDHSR